MAKKSIKSKGYRKTVAPKPYITKKELIIVCAVALALIIGLVLFNVFYNDGALKVVNGLAQSTGENNLIVNGGTTSSPRYYKLGQLADVEGFTLSSAPLGSDENVRVFTYTSDDPTVVETAILHSYIAEAGTLIEALAASYDTFEGVTRSDIITTEINEHTVRYITLSTDPATVTSTDESSSLEYMQILNAYVDLGNRCVSLQLRNDTLSTDEYVEDELLVETMTKVLSALSYETK